MISRARLDPARSARRCTPPSSVVVPIVASSWPKRAEAAAQMRSHASASSSPPPDTYPLHGGQRRKGQLLEVRNHLPIACKPLARLILRPAAEGTDVSAGGKDFSLGPQEQRS